MLHGSALRRNAVQIILTYGSRGIARDGLQRGEALAERVQTGAQLAHRGVAALEIFGCVSAIIAVVFGGGWALLYLFGTALF